jgi:UDP-N-acetylmuramoyl-tripeptide--D-alanyl-D-alanine ligase
MERMKLSEIVQAVEGSFGYPSDIEITSVSTDTRTIKPGSVFIALKGENFDGHDYGAKACELGAEAVIAERAIEGAKCIVVDSTARALLQLAGYYRRKFDIPLIGITGSVGKTTTKDMIALVVSKKYKTLKTEGNHNNEIGLPLTLFGIGADTQAAVIEMGMSNSGEISRLSMCCEPTAAVITNIGHSHIENLGSQQGILKAKMEILDGAQYMAPLILSLDDKLLSQIEPRHGRQIIFYSVKKKTADVYASGICADENGIGFKINYKGGSVDARLNCLGEHNVKNALAAFCVGLTLGIEPELMAQAIGEFKPQGIRQNIREVRGMTFIVDCYNAAPDSIKAALSTLSQTACHEGARRIAVLSDMLELGKHSAKLHKLAGEYVAASAADKLYCCGNDAKYYVDGAVKKGMAEENCRYFESKADMIEALKTELSEGDAVLFKGSRGMKLEEAVNALE